MGSMQQEYDLIVVGSGFAGTMTTLNFLEECKKLGKKGKFDSDWAHEMNLVSEGMADLDYCKKMEVEVPLTANYLVDHGVKLNHHQEKDVLLEFNADQYFAFPEGGGNAIINCLFSHFEKYEGFDMYWETQAQKLLLNDVGEISGVQVRKTDGRRANIHGKKVMLACGGFEGNKEMLAHYVGPDSEKLELIAPGLVHNTGHGLQMALEVGAATAGTPSGTHAELVDRRAKKPDAVIWGHLCGIVVNDNSTRFYDEGKRHLFATFETIALECWRNHNNSCYFVTDRNTMERFRPGWVYDTTDTEPEESDSIEGLAGKLGLDPAALRKTVDEYNAAIDESVPFDLMKLDRRRTRGLSPNKSNWALPIKDAPFYGYPMKAQLTFTYVGIKCDLESRVMGTNGAPIPGLFAAGELSGLFYNEYPPATSVLRSLTFGRLAGIAAANEL